MISVWQSIIQTSPAKSSIQLSLPIHNITRLSSSRSFFIRCCRWGLFSARLLPSPFSFTGRLVHLHLTPFSWVDLKLKTRYDTDTLDIHRSYWKNLLSHLSDVLITLLPLPSSIKSHLLELAFLAARLLKLLLIRRSNMASFAAAVAKRCLRVLRGRTLVPVVTGTCMLTKRWTMTKLMDRRWKKQGSWKTLSLLSLGKGERSRNQYQRQCWECCRLASKRAKCKWRSGYYR